MLVEKIVYNIDRKINILKYKYEQKYIDNFVTLHKSAVNNQHYKEIYQARKTIANYVSNEALAVDFYKPKKGNENDLIVKLTNLLTNKSTKRTVDTSKNTFNHVENDYFVIELASEGTQLVRKTKHEYEDNFIIHIFRQIVDMKNELKNNHSA